MSKAVKNGHFEELKPHSPLDFPYYDSQLLAKGKEKRQRIAKLPTSALSQASQSSMPWHGKDKKKLQKMVAEGKSLEEIARQMGRSTANIRIGLAITGFSGNGYDA